MKPIVLSLMLFFMVTAAQAQESGAPPQSGGQEPEMPGNETTITPSKRVLPEAAPEQKQLRQQKHEREKRIEKNRKCSPGKDAKACREQGVKNK
ncbi:hypothetical protein [Brucella pituitosa]|uniref:Uncharacterized protein n=1 Tax=Brucella pituitosa TaxID=571256 RepID=A0A643EWE6_9HYPH|nr:hypothetical protein [Brucella pituitosa]KAB0567683.1 hypothetical protein F7Q93_19950 [Brucella pituitosa]